MYNNLVSASPGPGRVVSLISFFLRTIPFSFRSPIRGMDSMPALLSFSSFDYAGDFRTQGLGLPPTAVGKRRIVWCWRSKMPLRVCSVQPSTMSV